MEARTRSKKQFDFLPSFYVYYSCSKEQGKTAYIMLILRNYGFDIVVTTRFEDDPK